MQKTFLKTKKKLNWNGGTVIWVILSHCKIVVVISAAAAFKNSVNFILPRFSYYTEMFVFTAIK